MIRKFNQNFISLLFIIFIVALFRPEIKAQKYVSDSLQLNFGSELKAKIPLHVDTIIDARTDLNGTQLRISEIKRYLYVPVDFFYVTPKPLKYELAALFSDSVNNQKRYKLIIKRFEIIWQTGIWAVPQILAQIEVYAGFPNEPKQLLGTLVFETKGKKPKKKKEKEAYEELVDNWKAEFVTNILKLAATHPKQRNIDFQNFIPGHYTVKQFIHTQTAISVGMQWYMIDVDLGFYDPECGNNYTRNTWFFKYRNEKRFEAYSFGSKSFYWYKRLNEHFVFAADQKFALGMNRWKNMNSYRYKIFDIAHLNAGLRAGIYYMPFGKQSILAGFHTSHDLFYIYSLGAFYRPGVGFSFGVNF